MGGTALADSLMPGTCPGTTVRCSDTLLKRCPLAERGCMHRVWEPLHFTAVGGSHSLAHGLLATEIRPATARRDLEVALLLVY